MIKESFYPDFKYQQLDEIKNDIFKFLDSCSQMSQ